MRIFFCRIFEKMLETKTKHSNIITEINKNPSFPDRSQGKEGECLSYLRHMHCCMPTRLI